MADGYATASTVVDTIDGPVTVKAASRWPPSATPSVCWSSCS